MPDLLTRPLLRRDEPAWGSRVPWFAAVLASGWVLIATLALCALPAVIAWIDDGAGAPLADPLRLGGRVWLLAHRVTVQAGDADLALAPLGLTFMVVLLMYRSARWAAHQAGTATPRGMLAVIAPAVLLYAVGAIAVAAASSDGEIRSAPVVAAGLCAAWGLLGFTVGVVHETGYDEVWFERLAPEVRAAFAGAAVSLAGLLIVGSILLVTSAALNSGQIGELAHALDAGILGNIVLIAGGAVIVPNGVIWAASFALGPGFAVGTDTLVYPGGVDLGMVPAVPVLGALPSSLPSDVMWLVLLGPVGVGVLAGWLVHRWLEPHGEPVSTVVLASGGTAAASALGMSALVLLSGGSAGALRLSVIGPVPWETAAMTFVAVGVPAILTSTVLAWRRHRAG